MTPAKIAFFFALILGGQHCHEPLHVAAQGAGGVAELPRGDQECQVKEQQQTDVLLELDADGNSGKGGGSGGRRRRNGSPMISPQLIPRFITPAVPLGERNNSANGIVAVQPSGRRMQQRQGSSANRDVDHVGHAAASVLDGCKPTDLDTDQALHTVLGAKAYQGPIPWVRDQKNCSTCVSHAFVAGIEASWAKTLIMHPRDLPHKLSATYPHYCGKITGPRDCQSEQFIGQFAYMVADDSSTFRPCLQMPDVPSYGDVRDACEAAEARCPAADAAAAGPRCSLLQPLNQADVQRFIVTFGGVVTPFTIPNSTAFREFFKQNPTGVWNDSSTCAEDDRECQDLTYHHAVLLIGYNNTDRTYTALNSWGMGFANQGTFKIRQGVGVVGLPSSSYAVACTPTTTRDSEAEQLRTAHVVPLADEPGCYTYTVNTTTTQDISVLATLLDVSIGGLLRNNTPAPIPVTNVTFEGSAAAGECPRSPTCGSNQTGPSPICVLEVAHDEAAGSCNVTAQVPVAVDLEGLTLKVCIPESTFKNYKTAVPVCPAGQQPTLSGTCEACPPHTYKHTSGARSCFPCPNNSYQPKPGSTACLPCPLQGGWTALLPADRAAAVAGCVKPLVDVKSTAKGQLEVPEDKQPASANGSTLYIVASVLLCVVVVARICLAVWRASSRR